LLVICGVTALLVATAAPFCVLAMAGVVVVLAVVDASGACQDVTPARVRILLNCVGLKKYIEPAHTTAMTKIAARNLIMALFLWNRTLVTY
jgi:hypothetical protein